MHKFPYRWYHGRLDRFTAEERLRVANKMGSYLVRESDRKPGSYVLSYLGRTGINHFRITAVCGDYYIGTVETARVITNTCGLNSLIK